MEWYSSQDDTLAIITAKKHLNSSHGNNSVNTLPNTCVLFEMGVGIRHIEANYNTKVLIEELPCFLYNPKCIGIVGYENLCFTCGGYGAPAAVDTLETLIALGVKKIIVVGMCGVFSDKINVGDVIIPHKILSEEGTSKHYFENHQYSVPDTQLYNNSVNYLQDYFKVFTDATVTTDAVYRQTFYKEDLWRSKNCVGVDMESSAILSVSKFYEIPAVSILIASDKHPLSVDDNDWCWGNADFKNIKRKFVDKIIEFAITQ